MCPLWKHKSLSPALVQIKVTAVAQEAQQQNLQKKRKKRKKENVFGAIDHCYFSCHSWYYGKVPATHSHCTSVPLLAVGHFHWRKKLFVSPSTVSRIGSKYCTQEQLDRSVKVHQPSTKTQICSFVQGGAGGAPPEPYKILQ